MPAWRSRAAWRSRVAALAAVLVFDAALHALLAQNPFGGPRPPAEPQAAASSAGCWPSRRNSTARCRRRSAPRNPTAARSGRCSAISFAYGIFHAAGPGHGKAVISSYLVANEETARRGIVLSFVSALMQALVAVADRRRSAPGCSTPRPRRCAAPSASIEIASYALIAAFGARLVWTKGGGFHARAAGDASAAAPLRLATAMAHARSRSRSPRPSPCHARARIMTMRITRPRP